LMPVPNCGCTLGGRGDDRPEGIGIGNWGGTIDTAAGDAATALLAGRPDRAPLLAERGEGPFACAGVGAVAGTWDGIEEGESDVPSTSRICCTGDNPACMLTGEDRYDAVLIGGGVALESWLGGIDDGTGLGADNDGCVRLGDGGSAGAGSDVSDGGVALGAAGAEGPAEDTDGAALAGVAGGPEAATAAEYRIGGNGGIAGFGTAGAGAGTPAFNAADIG